MPGCVGVCTWVWNESNGSWDPGGYNTCESGCMCGPAPGQEGPYDGYVATVACQGTPGSTTTTSSSSSSSSSSSTTTSSTTSSTTTSTTTTSAPCEGLCTYVWFPVGTGYQWVLQYSTCTAPGCYCNPPGYSGNYHGQEGFGSCLNTSPTTTTTTSTTTSTTSTAPPTTTTTTTGTGTTTSSTTTTTTTEQPCTGTCTWQWHADLQKWIKISGGNGTCSTGCSCSYPASNGMTDGETATPACKRLTCTKCCGDVNCCPMPFLTCCPTYQLKKKYYLTLIDNYGALPCINGSLTLELKYTSNFAGAGGYHYVYDIDGIPPTTYGYKTTLCANATAYSTPASVPNCGSTQFTDCNRDLKINGRFFIKDYYIPPYNCEFNLRIYLNSEMKSYVYQYSPSPGWVLSACHVQSIESDGGLTPYGQYNTWHSSYGSIDCSTFFPVNYETSSQVKECSAIPNPSAPPTLNSVLHYGAIADGTIELLVTE